LLLPLFFIFFCSTSAAVAQTAPGPWTLTFQSQTGDSVGQGETHTYTDADPGQTFTISSSANGVSLFLNGPSFIYWWDLDLHAPVGQPLIEGTYETARRAPFASFNGLSFSGSGRGCNTLTGRFVVLQASFGSGGAVQSFAADFEQHCEDHDPALFGSIRFHSTVPLPGAVSSSYQLTMAPPDHGTVTSSGVLNCGGVNLVCQETLGAPQSLTLTATPDAGYLFAGWNNDCTGGDVTALHVNAPKVCAARFELASSPDPRTVFLLASQSGDFVGFGVNQVFSPANSGNTRVSVTPGTNTKTVGFTVSTVTPTDETTWTFSFSAPNNENLQPNTTYSGALSFPGTHPAMSIRGDSSCSDYGRFAVRDLVFSGATLVSAAIDLEHHCGPAGDPALRAAIRYQSPIDPILPPLVYRLTLSPPAHGTITGTVDGLNCGTAGGPCVSHPSIPTAVTLSAVPDAGYLFAGFTGDCVLEASATIRINTIKDCSAAFEPMASAAARTMTLLDWGAGARSTGSAALREVFSAQATGIRATSSLSGRQLEFAIDTISGSGFTSSRRLTFSAPKGQILRKGGSYAATWWPLANVTAGMNIDFTCTQLTGRFVVLDVALAGDGTVLSAAIDFEQHCSGVDPALFGAIRFAASGSALPFDGVYPRYVVSITPSINGRVSGGGLDCGGLATACLSETNAVHAATLTAMPNSGFEFAGWSGACHGGATITVNVNGYKECAAIFEPTAAASRTRLTLMSQLGEPVLQGRTEIYSSANSSWSASTSGNGSGLSFFVTGLVDLQEQNWSLSFRDMSGLLLKPGTYTNATNSFSGTGPFLEVRGSGFCTVVGSSFTIRELVIGNFTVLRATIDFEQHCNSAGSPALTGTLVYQATSPITLDKTALSFASTVMPDNTIGNTTAAQVIRLTEPPDGGLSWIVTATSAGGWLDVTPSAGNTSANLTVRVVPGLAGLGAHTGTITVISNGISLPPITVTWTLLGLQTDPPVGLFETPVHLARNLSGAIPLTGWALDDVEVMAVQIWRQAHPSDPPAAISPGPGPQTGLVFIGNATFIDGARPDVEAVTALPNRSRAGWGYMMLTRGFVWDGSGLFTLHAIAIDREGHAADIGQRTISIDNALSLKPFGTIDTPGQGATASGLYANTGWVLSPSGAAIPAANVHVLIDGVPIAGVLSTAQRADLTAVFSTLDTTEAGRGLFIDTRAYTDGMHTIAWVATDANGQTDGIGSRFFRVANGGAGSLVAAEHAAARPVAGVSPESVDEAPPAMSPIEVRHGFDPTGPFETIQGSSDQFAADLEELDRLELKLPPARGATYRGYLRALGELRPLPAGARLDPATGTFTWQPGAGFLGNYDFVFVATGRNGVLSRYEVRVTIRPRSR